MGGGGTFVGCDPATNCHYPTETCPGQNCVEPNVPDPTDPFKTTDLQKAARLRLTFTAPKSSFRVKWGDLQITNHDWPQRMFFYVRNARGCDAIHGNVPTSSKDNA